MTVTGYPEPPAVGSEAAILLGALERQRALNALWHDAVARSRSAVAAALARGGMAGLSRTPAGAEFALRRLLVDMIEEYARHTGHADLLRESIDGRTGEDPPGPPHPYRLPTAAG